MTMGRARLALSVVSPMKLQVRSVGFRFTGNSSQDNIRHQSYAAAPKPSGRWQLFRRHAFVLTSAVALRIP
jgi:hypothetical protein